ncbi:MAG: 30S ribosomal protein S7 [Candidatus Woesearchaeota archaeon]
MEEIKAFGRWSTEGIKVDDAGLVDYISLKPSIVCRSGGRHARQKFYKSRVFIVERLMNKLIVPGHRGKKHKITSYHITGKAQNAHKIVERAFELIEQRTKQNPIMVFVKAVENAAPREEIISIEYGGARYPRAVECSPQRRVDVALRQMVQGAFAKSFNSKKSAIETVADEIIYAYQMNATSNAISKKLEIERQADTSR